MPGVAWWWWWWWWRRWAVAAAAPIVVKRRLARMSFVVAVHSSAVVSCLTTDLSREG
jgi:hypothetical protein